MKQAHNGAGVGNELLVTDPALATGHAGARHLHHLGRIGPSRGGCRVLGRSLDVGLRRRPVPRRPGGVRPGCLHGLLRAAPHRDRHPAHRARRTALHRPAPQPRKRPLRDLSAAVEEQLLDGSARLAHTYRAVGYRGRISTDAIVGPDGRLLFTEVNAQVSGSWHIYEVFAHHIVHANETPERTVTESHIPPEWTVPDGAAFHRALAELGLGYDPATRSGVIVSMPIVDHPSLGAQFTFSTVHASPADRDAIWHALEDRFTTTSPRGGLTPGRRSPDDHHDPRPAGAGGPSPRPSTRTGSRTNSPRSRLMSGSASAPTTPPDASARHTDRLARAAAAQPRRRPDPH
ncbi:hypothetical protein O1M63_18660 [Streptomyces mirabilis]|nr:hypothetical protein [Streptomyces mirabilis]